MASPPPSALSPPAPSSLALPRQRPGGPPLALPGGPPKPRRKPSTASATSSSHPLRQTSFPPPEGYGSNSNAMYSPEGSDISDSEITSAISGTTGNAGDGSGVGKKRKRGEKRARGRPPKSSAPGDDARSTTGTQKGAASTTGKGDEAEDDDEEDEDDAAAGRAMLDESAAQMEEADIRGKEFLLHMPEWQLERHGTWKRAKLKTGNVRTLVNQTLSQSVPANVITVVSAYTKMFAGLIVEGARDVQAEWLAVAEKRPDGVDNHVLKKLRGELPEAQENGKSDKTNGTKDGENGEKADAMDVDGDVTVKNEDESPKPSDVPHTDDTQPDADDEDDAPGGNDSTSNGDGETAPKMQEASMGVRRHIEEFDRGPLLPDHLREALRRYKKAQYGGTVGFTGLSLEGKDNAAARMGGRKLFK